MSLAFWLPLFVVCGVLSAAIGVAAGEYYHRTGDLERTGALLWGGLALSYFVLAVWLLFGRMPVASALVSAGSAFCAWRAWQFWRNRKDRKPSRVLGMVRDLGHRLAVVPIPGGAR